MTDCTDTIAAVATPPGRGGVGIVRLSGPGVPAIAERLLGSLPQPRYAGLHRFRNADGDVIDAGLALVFSGAPFLYRRARAGTARPRRSRGPRPVAGPRAQPRREAGAPRGILANAPFSMTNWISPRPKPLPILSTAAPYRRRAPPAARCRVSFPAASSNWSMR